MLRKDDSGWNPRVIALLAMVFICGVAFGAVGMGTYLHRFLPVQNRSDRALVYQGRRITLEQLQRDLDLNADQSETIKLILDDYSKFFLNLEDQRQSIYEVGRRKILDVLNDQQKAKFEQLLRADKR